MAKTLLVSPSGTAIYPKLNKADTKFKAEGEFSVKLRLPQETAEAFKAKLEAIYEAGYVEACNAAKKPGMKVAPKLKRAADMPWKVVTNDEGEETGELDFKFTKKASGVSKKTGEAWTATLPLIDAKRNPTKAEVWSGSILKVAFEPNVWSTALGVGISLRMHTVQIIKLVTRGQGGAATNLFEDEDGFVDSGEDDTSAPFADESGGEASNSVPTGDDPTEF